MSDFKLSWHNRDVAVEWPPGSVVLTRVAMPHSPLTFMPHHHSYMLSLYFSPLTFKNDKFKDWEFLLIEEPKNKQHDYKQK